MSAHKKRSSHNPSQPREDGGHPSQPDVPTEAGEASSGENMPQEKNPVEAATISLEDFEKLQKELDKARAQSAENFDGWQRERADFVNYKKRIERDQAQSLQNITGNVLKKYLVILDDLERALKNRPQGDSAAWAEGIELIYRKLQSLVESEGVKRIEADGQLFDPTLHEAITHEDSPDHQSGQIIEVVQQGYTLGERVLRPALVRVAR